MEARNCRCCCCTFFFSGRDFAGPQTDQTTRKSTVQTSHFSCTHRHNDETKCGTNMAASEQPAAAYQTLFGNSSGTTPLARNGRPPVGDIACTTNEERAQIWTCGARATIRATAQRMAPRETAESKLPSAVRYQRSRRQPKNLFAFDDQHVQAHPDRFTGWCLD